LLLDDETECFNRPHSEHSKRLNCKERSKASSKNQSLEEDQTVAPQINTSKAKVYGQTLQESSCTKGSLALEDSKRQGWSDCLEANQETGS